MAQEGPEKEEQIDSAESDIDFSKLTPEEKDALILEMHAEEMMAKQALVKKETKGKTKKRKKRKPSKNKSIAPGFGPVAVKMGIAMTLSMVFVFLGPIILIVALIGKAGVTLFGELGDKMWVNALIGLFGVALVVVAGYLFRYLVKD
ncbi:MAG: hypothetical protein K9W42_02195 [Candidatus Heimdallarchaeota archaeon]|nr:hypothetical protein [Candidatus Heimdallarchaeota archaeon]